MSSTTQGLFPNAGPSILKGQDRGNQKIKRDYTKDFYNNNKKSGYFHADYDEPTYLTFRVAFTFNDPSNVNGYNDMPMPLFNLKNGITTITQADADRTWNNYINGLGFNPLEYLDMEDDPTYQEATKLKEQFLSKVGQTVGQRDSYSTYEYLVNQKEQKRANLLLKFANMLKSIQDDCPYYFKSVDGLSALLKIDPKRGMRVNPEENTITIKCFEGLDMRITELLDTYRKIVWDEQYQRWVVPDMMRFFQMKIYVSEIRNFHISNVGDRDNIFNTLADVTNGQFKVLNTIANIINGIGSWMPNFSSADAWGLLNNELNNFMPTICITCNQCEFVIDDTLGHLNSLKADKGNLADDLEIKIRVGNIMETSAYPLSGDHAFKYTTWKDMENKAREVASDYDMYDRLNDEELFRTSEFSSAPQMTKDILDVKEGRGGYTKFSNEPDHGAYEKFAGSKRYSPGLIGGTVKSAINWGIGFADNWLNDKLNKVINSPIGGTLSLSEAFNALNSKDAINMYNTVRDAMKKSAEFKEDQKKERDITMADMAFKSFVREIAQMPLSKATSKLDHHDLQTTEDIVIEIAKKINEADFNTEELDQFFKAIESMYINETYPSQATWRDKITKFFWDVKELREATIEAPEIEEPELVEKDINNLYEDKNDPELTLKNPYSESEEPEKYIKIQKGEGYNDLPLSEAVENANQNHSLNLYDYDEDFSTKNMSNENDHLTVNPLTSYKNVPLSEATENFEYEKPKNIKDFEDLQNDAFDDQRAVMDKYKLGTNKPEISDVSTYSNVYKTTITDPYEDEETYKNDKITGIEDPYKGLAMSEAVENNQYVRSEQLKDYDEFKDYTKEYASDIEGLNKVGKISKIDTYSNEPVHDEILHPVYPDLPLSEAVENTDYIDSQLLDFYELPPQAEDTILREMVVPDIDTDLPLSEAPENRSYEDSDLFDYYEIKEEVKEKPAIHNVIDPLPILDNSNKSTHIESLFEDDDLALSEATENRSYEDSDLFDYYEIKEEVKEEPVIHDIIDPQEILDNSNKSNKIDKLYKSEDLPLSEAVENVYDVNENLTNYKDIKEDLISDLPLSSATDNFIVGEYDQFLTDLRKMAFSTATSDDSRMSQVAAIIYARLKSTSIKKLVNDDKESVLKTIVNIYKNSDELSNEDKKLIKTIYEELYESRGKDKLTVPEFINDMIKRISVIKPYDIENPELSRATTNRHIEKFNVD